MRLLGVLLVLVGCHGAGSVAPDASTEPDVPPRAQGMTVTWNARPSVPGMISDQIMVTDAMFQLEHLQLVSDAGGTTHTRLQLAWSSQGAPADEEFPDAPVARYQQILLDMRSDVRRPFSYQIEGIWQDNESPRPFRITDATILEVPIACDVALPANGAVTVPIRLDLRGMLDAIDFGSLPLKDGTLVLDSGPQLLLIQNAFVLDD